MRLTLWGAHAEVAGAELEQEDCPILAISACRVSDFDGAAARAQASNPGPEPQALPCFLSPREAASEAILRIRVWGFCALRSKPSQQ